MDEREAAAALAEIRGVQGRVAARAHWSLGRHLVFGALMGVLVALQALPVVAQIGGAALCVAATGLIVAADRRRDGFFVNGYRAGRTRWIAVGMALVTAAMLALGVLLREELGWRWAPLAAGAVTLIAGTLGSMGWERAYRAELAGQRQ